MKTVRISTYTRSASRERERRELPWKSGPFRAGSQRQEKERILAL